MINYIAMSEKLVKDVLDAKTVRGMYEGSDHCVVLAKIKVDGNMAEEMARRRWMDRKEVKEEYERMARERLRS